MHDFNLALLGKQGWRMLTHNDSLASRIVKARYYPKGSFLSTSLDNNPNFVWKSIFQSQQLIRVGVRRTIKIDNEALILNESWLPSDDHPYVLSNHPSLANKAVSNLLKLNEKV